VRSVATWTPAGKARARVFRSLASHLLAKYEVPAILWNALFEDDAPVFAPLVAHVAAGGSLYAYARDRLTVSLTRAMCHELITTPADYGFVDAIRLAQARAAGADRRLADAWRRTAVARRIGTKEDEAFWFSVIAWLANAAMLDLTQLGPLSDFIAHRRREDAGFTVKKRSVVAMIRAMHEWHGALGAADAKKLVIFRASGFRDADYRDMSRIDSNGEEVREIWRVRELLSSRALFDEGRRMGHCVYSYAWQVERGTTSIWAITMEDGKGETGNWAMVTVEVRNDLRRVVQARGRFNRAITSREHGVLARWAGMNGLAITL
jgi:hypothetical protein